MPLPEQSYTEAAIEAVRAAVDSEDDFGGWLSQVLSTVAEERGGSAALVVGRPGSWEAEHVVRLACMGDWR